MDPFGEDDCKELHLTLISNSEPGNTSFHFRNTLPVPVNLRLGETWEVALQSISVSSKLSYDPRFILDNETLLDPIGDDREEKMAKEETLLEDEGRREKRETNPNNMLDPDTAIPMSSMRNLLIVLIVKRQKLRKQLKELRIKINHLRHKQPTYEAETENTLLKSDIREFIHRKKKFLRVTKKIKDFSAVFQGLALRNLMARFSPVHVEIDQVAEKECGGKEIAFLSLDYCMGDRFVNHTPEFVSFFPLAASYVSKLDVRLKDLEGNTLVGTATNPTLVNLTLRKRQENKMSFDGYEYHTCYINSSPGESPSDFHASLPNFLTKLGCNNRWEMALVQSSIPHRFLNLPAKLHIEILERYHEDLDHTIYEMFPNQIMELLEKTRRNPHYYHTVEEQDLTQNPDNAELFDLVRDMIGDVDHDTGRHPTVYTRAYKTADNKLYITANRPMIFVMHSNLAIALGLEKQVVMLPGNYCCLELEDSKRYDWLPLPTPGASEEELLNSEDYKSNESRFNIFGHSEIDISLIQTQNLLLYADCITPTLFGNSYGQYLTNIPVHRHQSFYTEYSCPRPLYHKLNTNKINRIHFKLYHIDGREISYEHHHVPRAIEKYRTHMTLSLRRKIEKMSK
jgi:hypothetical protein